MIRPLALAAAFATALYALPVAAQITAPAPEATAPEVTGRANADTGMKSAPSPRKHHARHHHKAASAKPDMAMPDSSQETPTATQPK